MSCQRCFIHCHTSFNPLGNSPADWSSSRSSHEQRFNSSCLPSQPWPPPCLPLLLCMGHDTALLVRRPQQHQLIVPAVQQVTQVQVHQPSSVLWLETLKPLKIP
jgi:hypothetical protein